MLARFTLSDVCRAHSSDSRFVRRGRSANGGESWRSIVVWNAGLERGSRGGPRVIEFAGPTDFFGPYVRRVVEDAVAGRLTALPGVDWLTEAFNRPHPPIAVRSHRRIRPRGTTGCITADGIGRSKSGHRDRLQTEIPHPEQSRPARILRSSPPRSGETAVRWKGDLPTTGQPSRRAA